MKRVKKVDEPASLTCYRNAVPNGTWDDLGGDTKWGGQKVPLDCRKQAIEDQGGLCAYCEIVIRDNNPLKCRVEHFHPKSDVTLPLINWALSWQNMLGVCNGGSNPHVSTPGFHLVPLKQNLSCDAHKDQQIQTGVLPLICEGWILNPLEVRSFPCLFKINKFDGHLEPDPIACQAAAPWPGNRHATVDELVQHTIDMLNLNCDRLKKSRLALIWDIERNKKGQRQQGFDAEQGMTNLVQHYFRQTWPGFFTVIRLCLGQSAETHLQAVHFQG